MFRNKRNLIFIVLGILGILLAMVYGLINPRVPERCYPGEYRIFISKAFGYSIDYPATWKSNENKNGTNATNNVIASFLFDGEFWPQINIRHKLVVDSTEGDIKEWEEKYLSSYDDIFNLSIQEYDIEDYSGLLYVYHREYEELSKTIALQCMSFVLESDGKLFGINMCFPEEDLAQAEEVFFNVAGSFKIE